MSETNNSPSNSKEGELNHYMYAPGVFAVPNIFSDRGLAEIPFRVISIFLCVFCVLSCFRVLSIHSKSPKNTKTAKNTRFWRLKVVESGGLEPSTFRV